MQPKLGSIYTPPGFANILSGWAIQFSHCKVLDLGIGEGAFVYASLQRLMELGAIEAHAQEQIYGAEIDIAAYTRFLDSAQERGLQFPNLRNLDFFELDLPPVDSVVGNPPYVRRAHLDRINDIREKVLNSNHSLESSHLHRLTDLYVYFLLHAAAFLKPQGRLAVITADSWLNVGYGKVLKEYLTSYFEIERLISLDRRVFDDAQVKPVLLFATKKAMRSVWHIDFVRVKNGLPIDRLQQYLNNPAKTHPDVVHLSVKGSDLKAEHIWGIHFKAPEIYDELASLRIMFPISRLANTRIGVQTLAKDFFVLTPRQVQDTAIESEFLQPLAQSARYCYSPTIDAGTNPDFYVFYCSDTKDTLKGTAALKYIERAEAVEIRVRGKNTTVIGYQNKERIKESSRKNWYDLKTAIERRGRAAILIPRLVYRTFTVVWNQAQFVPGELFIEFLPASIEDTEVYLAILNSSLTEIMLRTHAQVYGGGTYNINPGEVKKVPIINAGFLTYKQKCQLVDAYRDYVADSNHDRDRINQVVYAILGFDTSMQHRLQTVLEDLHLIATSSKQASS